MLLIIREDKRLVLKENSDLGYTSKIVAKFKIDNNIRYYIKCSKSLNFTSIKNTSKC